MSVKVKDIMGVMETIAPKKLAEGWDNVGLAIGDPEREVTKILVALDVIDPVIEEAKEIGAQMIVTHHPMLLFKKIESITTQNALGRRIYNLIENGISAFSAHTNLDIAKGGTNDVLAELA
ncbi:MAG: Nif3-like dinuclear metal center hexameric protein, partial [Anaerotignum sp.]|nr:Nif3-like dinuclear metal center hexameric protein [Anaerotignum sp.]